MNPYISDLERALKEVDSSYVTFLTYTGLNRGERIENSPYFASALNEGNIDQYIRDFINSQKTLAEHSLERNFCYQLYFTWQTIVKRDSNKIYNSLKLNGEINKSNLLIALKSYSEVRETPLFQKLEKLSLLDKTYFVPDLVLHGGQDNVDHQKLIVEVKYGTNLKNGKFSTDFYKLALYQKIFQFSDCVYLIVNISIKELLGHLATIDVTVVDSRRIWFMIRSESKTYTFRLSDLV